MGRAWRGCGDCVRGRLLRGRRRKGEEDDARGAAKAGQRILGLGWAVELGWEVGMLVRWFADRL